MRLPTRRDFPKDFTWGVATAAYQIEGAASEDGRGPSIWDTFSNTPGKTKNGDTGDVACDHYHRLEGDLDLLRELGVNAYRFSLSWSRVLPEGRGRVNEAGLDFYERVVDGLLARGIEPWVTLYHWDLPQTLQDEGGWARRETVEAFLEYVDLATKRLGDRVRHWITHNEPWCTAFLGHLVGIHAPGTRGLGTALQVAHHLLLSHGKAVPLIRTNAAEAQVGITLNLHPSHLASDSPEDVDAARRMDGYQNRWFLDPLYGRGYPRDMFEHYGLSAPRIAPGDLEAIAATTDFLGVNYYTRQVIAYASGEGVLELRSVQPEGSEYTHFGWEVYPDGLREVLARVAHDYSPAQVAITENGAAYQDVGSSDGQVKDEARRAYIEGHIQACLRAVHEGVPLTGYFAWSFMDNFEWAEGFDKRFGLIYVNFASQKRRVKASGGWYRGFLGKGP